jgi:hypothetical protein
VQAEGEIDFPQMLVEDDIRTELGQESYRLTVRGSGLQVGSVRTHLWEYLVYPRSSDTIVVRRAGETYELDYQPKHQARKGGLVPGKGGLSIGGLTFGMSKDEVSKKLGPAGKESKDSLWKYPEHIVQFKEGRVVALSGTRLSQGTQVLLQGPESPEKVAKALGFAELCFGGVPSGPDVKDLYWWYADSSGTYSVRTFRDGIVEISGQVHSVDNDGAQHLF